jgi:RNA 3'-terminal phosphate cyclase (ATP)
MVEYLELDGSVGEGGGQVLRVALALSAILNKPLHIYNIRKKRDNPGLRNQHLTAVRAVQAVCGGVVRGGVVGSTELYFQPGPIKAEVLKLDTGTAGSTMLVLQSLLPVLCYAPRETSFQVKGGTNNPNAPSYEYFEHVFIPTVRRMGVNAGLRLVRRGFYPRGGGVVEGYCRPVEKFTSLNLTSRPEVVEVFGKAYTCRLPPHVAERMASSCEKVLKAGGYNARIEREVLADGDASCALDPGAGICVVARCGEGVLLGVDKLGERGVPAERVGEAAAQMLLEELSRNAPVDKHLGDMLVIYASLAEGRTVYEVTFLTSHTVTSIEVCKLLTGCKASYHGEVGGRGRVTVDGIGFFNDKI